MKERGFSFVAALVVVLATSGIANATTITAVNGGTLDANHVLSGGFAVSSTDLLQTNLSSSAITAGGASFGTTLAAVYNGIDYEPVERGYSVTDGVQGFAPGNSGPNVGQVGYYGFAPTTIEFVLDTNANPLGYNLSRIVCLSGYIEHRNTAQEYAVNVMKVGATEWTSLYSVDHSLANNNSVNPEVQVTASDFGAAGNGVAKIQMIFTVGSTYVDATQYREIDVIGSAVPEPCTSVLLTTALFGLLAYAWRKQK